MNLSRLPLLILPDWRPLLDQAPAEGDLTWAYPWPAGERLAADLASVADCTGKRIAELGCGRGRTGLTALQLGAEVVIFCDLAEEPLGYVTEALAANHFTERGRTQRHAWGEPVAHAPFDLILGADILYRPAYHPALLRSIVASLAPNGTCLLADPRTELEPELPAQAAALGLTWQCQRRPGEYTLVELKKSSIPLGDRTSSGSPVT